MMRPIHLRLSALCLPLFFWRQKASGFGRHNSDADCVAGTRALAPSAPAKRGRGTTRARAKRAEGGGGGAGRGAVLSLGKILLARRSGRAEMFGRDEDSCGASSPAPPPPRCARSPSPAIAVADDIGALRPAPPPPPCCAGWSPSPASRGRKERHIFNRRLALPLRILALSSSESGTVCIQSSAGGFMTNGQSTANRI